MKQLERDIMVNDEVVSTLKFQIHPDMPDTVLIHHDVYKWSPQIYKEHLLVWQVIKDAFTNSGMKKICCTQTKQLADDLMLKYWRKWGFIVKEVNVMGQDVYVGEMEL